MLRFTGIVRSRWFETWGRKQGGHTKENVDESERSNDGDTIRPAWWTFLLLFRRRFVGLSVKVSSQSSRLPH